MSLSWMNFRRSVSCAVAAAATSVPSALWADALLLQSMSDMPGEIRIITIRTSRLENFAELSVSDRGPGIPENKLRQVFEPFFTSKAEGMGMGLSIARTIIEAHQGQISATNRCHGGASFRIKLPLIQ